MKTMSVGNFKANCSEILKLVIAGEEIGILYGKNKKVVAKIVPNLGEKKPKRKLGILEGKGSVKFGANFKMREEEFLRV